MDKTSATEARRKSLLNIGPSWPGVIKGGAMNGAKLIVGVFAFAAIAGPIGAVILKPVWLAVVWLWNMY